VEVPVKESLLVALRLKLAFGITMLLLFCGVSRADSQAVSIPCPAYCAGDTDTVTLTTQPPGVIGLGAADTFITFNFQMVDTQGVDMNGFTFLKGPAGSGIDIGFSDFTDTFCASPGSAYNNTVVPGETFNCGLSVDIGNRSTATPGIYAWGLGLLDWADRGVVVWNPTFTTDVLAPAVVGEPAALLLLIPSLLALAVFRLKRATA
jgi:hypothetical protein